MELDPITYFLHAANNVTSVGTRQKRFNLSAFINVHSRLSILQMNKGHVSFEDLLQSLNLTFGASSEAVSVQDINAYAGVIYEASFQPIMLSKGPSFVLDRSVVGNDANFLKAVLAVLQQHNGGKDNHVVIEALRADMVSFLQRSGNATSSFADNASNNDNTSAANSSSPSVTTAAADYQRPGAPSSMVNSINSGASTVSTANSFALQQQRMSSLSGINGFGNKAAPSSSVLGGVGPGPMMDDPYMDDARAILNAGMEIEKNEPIVRLLAHIRKAGMDILFPQIIHDKILMCIFVSMRCAHSLAHRELIDVVMAIKEARAVTQLDSVSRTKVRGVLALLKHAQMFITHGEEGEAVRLHLTPAIATFKDLREKHDAFVNRCILQHHLFIPVSLKGELIWQLDAETRELRLQELQGLEAKIDAFLSSGPGAAVLEPFLAIARTVQIPTNLPPSLQVGLNNVTSSSSVPISSSASSSVVGAGGVMLPSSSQQGSLLGPSTSSSSSIYSNTGPAPSRGSVNLPPRSLPVGGGNTNYSMMISPPSSNSSPSTSNLNYLNNAASRSSNAPPTSSGGNFYYGGGAVPTVSSTPISLLGAPASDRTLNAQKRSYLPESYGSGADRSSQFSALSSNPFSSSPNQGSWIAGNSGNPSYSSASSFGGAGRGGGGRGDVDYRGGGSQVNISSSYGYGASSSMGLGSTYGQQYSSGIGNGSSLPVDHGNPPIIAHNFDTYSRPAAGGGTSTYGNHETGAPLSSVELANTDAFFFSENEALRGGQRGNSFGYKEELLESEEAISNPTTHYAAPMPPGLASTGMPSERIAESDECNHDEQLLQQLKLASIDNIVGESILAPPAPPTMMSSPVIAPPSAGIVASPAGSNNSKKQFAVAMTGTTPPNIDYPHVPN